MMKKIKVGDKFYFKQPATNGYGECSFLFNDVVVTEIYGNNIHFNSFYKNKFLDFFFGNKHICIRDEFVKGIVGKSL